MGLLPVTEIRAVDHAELGLAPACAYVAAWVMLPTLNTTSVILGTLPAALTAGAVAGCVLWAGAKHSLTRLVWGTRIVVVEVALVHGALLVLLFRKT